MKTKMLIVKKPTQKHYSTINLRKWLLETISLSGQIRKIRLALGMTQAQLARKIGSRQSVVARLEKDDLHNFRLYYDPKIC